jgi:hypothetical protein
VSAEPRWPAEERTGHPISIYNSTCVPAGPRDAAIAANWSRAACRSSTISAAMTSGAGGSRSPLVTHRAARRYPATPCRMQTARRRRRRGTARSRPAHDGWPSLGVVELRCADLGGERPQARRNRSAGKRSRTSNRSITSTMLLVSTPAKSRISPPNRRPTIGNPMPSPRHRSTSGPTRCGTAEGQGESSQADLAFAGVPTPRRGTPPGRCCG